MNIAIHHRPGSFSDQWIAYCEREKIPYKFVNCFDTDIIDQLRDCDALLWHHHHGHFKDVLAARKILFAMEHAGIRVFPDFYTGWHFDDKVAQKYLLEAVGAPFVPSYVFYDKEEALSWAAQTEYPKVFKLKGGAGSANVRLVKDEAVARRLIRKAFGKGFSQFDRIGNLRNRYQMFRAGKDSIVGILKGMGRLFVPTNFALQHSRERGYVYFQDFIPDNNFDTRVVVIGNKAAAEQRKVRHNDFRASGSGLISFEDINLEAVKIAFDISRKADFSAMAFDFVENEKGRPLIVEISYGFGTKGIIQSPGYWDQNLNWHEGKFNPQEWIIDNLVK